jgi:hypothetical protein
MKAIRTLLACAALSALSFHLQAQGDGPLFFIVDYMKATPGKSAEYVQAEMGVWKKIHQERKKRGLIESWYLYSVRYTGTSSEYDYVTVTSVRGFDKLENPWGDLFDGGMEKLLTKEQVAAANGIVSLRNLLRTEIYYGEDFVAANPSNPVPPKYLVVNYMDVPTGGWDRYYNMETKLVKPVHVEQMKDGGKAAWGFYSRAMPRGDGMATDAVTVDFYNKWTDMEAGGDFRKAFEKVHPGMSESYFEDEISQSRTLTYTEMWEQLDYVQ